MTSVDKMRIGGSKVKTGCRTCKTRRVKCDEGRPSCARCIKAGRNCEGYSPSSTPSPGPSQVGSKFVHYVEPARIMAISRSPSPHAESDTQALRALHFFQHSTATQVAGHFSGELWTKVLPIFVQQDSAIKSAVITLSSLHENFLHPSSSTFQDQRKLLALEHYGKSIQGVVQLNQRNGVDVVSTTILSCVLYCATESIRGHFLSAMKHIVAGIALLTEHEQSLLDKEAAGLSVVEGFVQMLRNVFVGLGSQVLNMDDSQLNNTLLNYLHTSDKEVSYSFSTTNQALVDGSHLTNDILQFLTWAQSCHSDRDFPSNAMWLAGDRLQRRYDNWTASYHKLLADSDMSDIDECQSEHLAMLVLRINQLLMRILLDLKFEKGQTAFDKYLQDFKLIVDTAETFIYAEKRQSRPRNSSPGILSAGQAFRPIFSMNSGIVVALFFVCIRCRERITRYRSLEILKTCKRREAIWDSDVVSVVAERLIAREEENALRIRQEQGMETEKDDSYAPASLPTDQATNFMPEDARIKSMLIDYLGMETGVQIVMLGSTGTRHLEYIEWKE